MRKVNHVVDLWDRGGRRPVAPPALMTLMCHFNEKWKWNLPMTAHGARKGLIRGPPDTGPQGSVWPPIAVRTRRQHALYLVPV
jgi:hypothetical protein